MSRAFATYAQIRTHVETHHERRAFWWVSMTRPTLLDSFKSGRAFATRPPTMSSPNRPAKLALSDGTVFTGRAFGADGEIFGEVVFNTSMTGYQEILTDPSYCGQIVTMHGGAVQNRRRQRGGEG